MDELVKRLRYCSKERDSCGMCALSSDCVLRVGLLTQAADAIVELQKVGNILLAKYEEEATTVIWEYSGNIDESLDKLRKEVGKYKAQINGEEE